jgi:hypothetical protein
MREEFKATLMSLLLQRFQLWTTQSRISLEVRYRQSQAGFALNLVIT